MRALLIVNPNATSTTPRYRSLIARALGAVLDVAVVSTDWRGHARELVGSLDGYDVVIGFGGDGTINEVCNGLIDPASGQSRGPRLGIIPGGDANVFARAAGIAADPSEATEQLIEAIGADRTRTLNLGRLNWQSNDVSHSRVFNFCAGLGFDAEVVHEVDRLRSLGRDSSPSLYLNAIAKTLFAAARSRGGPPICLFGENGEQRRLSVALISTTDPWTYLKDRPIRPTPEASFESGLDLMGITSNSAGVLINAGQTLLRGQTPRGRSVLHLHDQSTIVLEGIDELPLQADGEVLGFTKRVEIYDLPKAVELYY